MDTIIETDFVSVPDADDLDAWLPRPGVVLLFLHDPNCPTSRRASWEVAEVGGEVGLCQSRVGGAESRRTAR